MGSRSVVIRCELDPRSRKAVPLVSSLDLASDLSGTLRGCSHGEKG